MSQQDFNAKLIATIEQMSDVIGEQQKRIEKIEKLLATLQDPLIHTMETVQRHDERINMIVNKMIELGFDKK